jgi:hypothetical protein
VAAVVFAVCGWVDARQVAGLAAEAEEYVTSGGATWVLEAPGGISGVVCDRLVEASGIEAAGALRRLHDGVVLAALPGAAAPAYEVTPGLVSLLGAPSAAGVVLPEPLAARLGVTAGDQVAGQAGWATVAGVYSYPDDGRRSGLGYAVLSPTAVDDGVFDECWLRVWPTDERRVNLSRMALLPGSMDLSGGNAKLGQLNSRYAAGFDGARRFAERPTRFAQLAACGGGLILGAASVLSRRLAVAADLHAGLPRGVMAARLAVTAVVWIGLAVGLALPAALAGAAGAEAGGQALWELFWPGLRAVLAGAAGAFLGVLGAAGMVRERQLFKLFKSRL